MKRTVLHSGIITDVCAQRRVIPSNRGNQEPGSTCAEFLWFIFYYGPRVGNLRLVVFYETFICNIANVRKEKNLFSSTG